jgi:Domain of unknown function (DUF4386)
MNQQEASIDRTLLRTGAIAAVAGVIAALVSTAIDPSRPDDPTRAIQQASESSMLALSRVLDMAAFLLLLVAVAVATRALSAGTGGAAWARIGLAFFTVSAGAGAIATMIVASFADIGDDWAKAPASQKAGYVAAYDALDNVSGGVFGVSWAALGVFGLLFAVAISRSRMFPRPLAWTSAASGLAGIIAIVVGIGLQGGGAFLFLLVGILLFYVVILSLGAKLWRLGSRARSDDGPDAPRAVRRRAPRSSNSATGPRSWHAAPAGTRPHPDEGSKP